MTDKLHDAVRALQPKRVAQLLSGSWFRKPLPVDAADMYGLSALHIASGAGHIDIITALLDKGAALNSIDSEGRSAIHWAAIFGRRRAVETLLSKGADANAQDQKGNTPLHCAAGCYEPVDLKRYIAAQLVPGAAAAAGWQTQTAQQRATALKIADALEKMTFLEGGLEVVTLLLSKGARPDVRNKEGHLPGHFAVLPKVKELLPSG